MQVIVTSSESQLSSVMSVTASLKVLICFIAVDFAMANCLAFHVFLCAVSISLICNPSPSLQSCHAISGIGEQIFIVIPLTIKEQIHALLFVLASHFLSAY